MFKKTKKDADQITNVADISEAFGKYQMLQYFYVSLPTIFVSMINVNFIFVAGEVGYRCLVPECDSSNTNYSVPWWPNHTDQCMKPLVNQTYLDNGICSNNSFTGAMEPCTQWVYENNDTIIPELNLACQPWKRTMVGAIHNIGMTIAEMVAGWTSDIYGRKLTLILCSLGCVLGNFKTLATSYSMYVSLEFLEAIISGGVLTAGGILSKFGLSGTLVGTNIYVTCVSLLTFIPLVIVPVVETAGNKNRVLAGVLFAYAVYMGEALFALIGLAVPYWKTLIQIICTPAVLFLFYFISVNESPRWLILKGRSNEAKEVLKKIVKTNKINIDMEEINSLDEEKLKIMYKFGNIEKKQGLKQVYQCKELFTWLLVTSFCRFTVSLVYYGLLVNSVVLPGDKNTNFILAAVMSFPGELVSMFFMNRIGRRSPLMVGFLVCGVACVASGYAPESWAWLKICLFLIGKLVTSACYTGTLTYSMELFPTSVRGSLIGLCTVASSVGNMLAPLTPLLTPLMSSILFACSAVISSGLLFLTPETKGAPLMDTIEQVAESIKAAKDKKNNKGNDNLGFNDNQNRNDVI